MPHHQPPPYPHVHHGPDGALRWRWGRGAPAHRHPPPDPIVEILRKLTRHDHIANIAGLIDMAGRLGRPDVVEVLVEIDLAYASPPTELALDELESRLRLDGHRRRQESLSAAEGKAVALIFPLAPHVHEEWVERPGTTILIPSGHHLPAHLGHGLARVIDGTRACRRAVGEFDLVLVEAYRGDAEFLGDVEVVDVMDRNYVSSDTWVQVHLRPHRHHEDVPFNLDRERFSSIL